MIPRRAAPPTAPGLRIGLYGGSFNPPHAAHRLVAEQALRRIKLDRIWWMATPGNPLKDNSALPTTQARLTAMGRLAPNPRFAFTAIEEALGSRYSYEAIVWLQRRFPEVRFVWIIGADSFVTLHRWRKWRAIMARIPVAVIDRPGSTLAATASVAARTFAAARLPEAEANRLATRRAPAWTLLHGPRSTLSSTQLRTAGAR